MSVLVSLKMKAYPSWSCQPCGHNHGKRKFKFPEDPDHLATFHYGKCDVCGENGFVTEPRDYGHFPNWFKK